MSYWDRSNEDNLSNNDLIGAVDSYLNMKRPPNWYSMPVGDMQAYFDAYDFQNDKTTLSYYKHLVLEKSDKFCIQEIWKIGLRQKDVTINRYYRDLLEQALEHLGWRVEKRQTRFGAFGSVSTVTKAEGKSLDDLPF
jgi:hypothetical protein